MTFKQMQDQVMQWLGLQQITGYDESKLASDLLYQGTLDLLSRTRCTVRCIDLQLQADVGEYLLDHSILALVDVENGDRRRLNRGERSDVYGFALIRSDLLRVVPTPSADGEMQVWAVKRPDQMALPDDSPALEQFGAIPDEYHDAIVTYALWKGADYADDATTQSGEYYRTLYEGPDGRGGRLSQIRVLVNKRGTAAAPRMRVKLSSISRSGAYT